MFLNSTHCIESYDYSKLLEVGMYYSLGLLWLLLVSSSIHLLLLLLSSASPLLPLLVSVSSHP